MGELTELCELARHYGTDKGGWHHPKDNDSGTCHNYTPAYHELFKRRRKSVRWMLEIGIAHGYSLRMWRDYFPNAQIIGLDRDPPCIFTEERIRCFLADQNSREDLERVVNHLGNPGFDLIVDDGSHVAGHQIFAARVLLPALSSKGIYVIEDLERDCRPELVAEAIAPKAWRAIPTGIGLGRARCECGCGQGEQLLVLR